MVDDVVIDLTTYKDRTGERVAPGRYRVVVEDVELAESKQKNPMINVWFTIIGGEYDSATIVDRLTLTEKALFRVVGFMQAIGMPTPRKRLKFPIRQFVGKHLDIDVDDGDPFNGRVKSEVRGYLRLPKGEAASNGAQDVTDLDGLEEFAPAQDAPGPAEPKPGLSSQADAEDVSEDEDEGSEIDLDKIVL